MRLAVLTPGNRKLISHSSGLRYNTVAFFVRRRGKLIDVRELSDANPLWPGVPLALASALLFGASTPFAKLLVETSNPQLLAGLLYLGQELAS